MSRSRCGYCNGSRLGVLRVRDGHNKVLQGGGDANDSMAIQDDVDEHKTTKSYGLSFESLPCETYEDMIDRGWRRSGKHLYLPINTEICCPQLPIRLDVVGFEQTAKKPTVECDTAKNVLVRGSKSQRKVGKLLLRALEVHNNKQPCTRNDEHGNSSEEMHKHKKPRSGEATGPVHTSNNRPNIELFLQKLSKVVYNTVTADAKKVVDLEASGDTPSWAWWDDDSLDFPKWCSFKLNRAQRSKAGFVTVTTSACAAASGRSRHALDRSRLGAVVIQALCEANFEGHVGVSFEGVSLHDKSGHVHVHLKCDDNMFITAPRSTLQASKRGSHRKVTDSIDEFITRQQKFASRLRRSANNGDRNHQKRYLTVHSVPSLESSNDPEVFELFCHYQTVVHKDSDPFFGEIGGPETSHSDEYARTKEMCPSPGFLDVDAVYCDLSEDRRNVIKKVYLKFYRFLCETPVKQDKDKGSFELTDGYDIHIPNGTFHQVICALPLSKSQIRLLTLRQHYRLSTTKDGVDGPIIAVSVIDLLPQCLSSVYSFYDPILSSRLELGKYTALREIEFVSRRRASKLYSRCRWYHLGFYVHNNPKMTYKSSFRPSQLLCPVYKQWIDFDAGRRRLEEESPVRHCCALDKPAGSPNANNSKPSSFRVDDLLLDVGNCIVSVGLLNAEGRGIIDSAIQEFVAEVGEDISHKFVIALH